MVSRLILKNVKAPIHFLLRNPASSAPSSATAPLAQTIQNLLVPRQNPQSAGEFSRSGLIGSRYRFGVSELGLNDRPPLSMYLKSSLDGGFRIEARGKRQSVDDDDYQSDYYDLDHGSSDDDNEGDACDLGDFDDADCDDGDEE